MTTRKADRRHGGADPALWRRDADVVVVGSGAAGISAALTAAAGGLRVLVVTKDLVGGATPLAQGGLAAALGPGDTPAAHAADTLVAGAGLCSPDTVTPLAQSAPGAIGWLTGLGAQLETRDLRLEGGHSARRIVHSGDDATGAEVHRALLSALLASGIEIADRTVALDLLLSDPAARESAGQAAGHGAVEQPAGFASERTVTGLLAGAIGADGRLTPGVIAAQAVVIAAGGLGQAFGTTSNPAGATGDGIAIAARAGAVIRDLEFVQFHPTVLWLPGASGQCPLITEALRGAGAVLRDLDGTPLMAGHDPRGDLAPRDVVAARMAEVIAAGDAGHVWLDATGLGRDLLENGFPTVTAACRKHGIDPVRAMIPVAPGAHYSCGGIRAGLDGRTTIQGLFAVGEAASTGIQGANRLASNSVTEAIIAGRRTGTAIADACGIQDQIADACGIQDQNASGIAARPTTSDWSSKRTGSEYSATVPPELTSVPALGHAEPEYPGHMLRESISVRALWHTRPEYPGPKPAETRDVRALCATRPEYSGLVAHRDASSGLVAHAASSFWSWVAQGQKGAAANPSGDGALASRGRAAAGRGAAGQGAAGQGAAGQGAAGQGAAGQGAAGRGELTRAMSRYAGVMRDAAGLSELLQVITDAGPALGCGELGRGGTGRERAEVPEVLELEVVEAANLRTVSLLIAAGALRRAESRGCHRRRDATETAAVPWHTLARWDGQELIVTKEAM